MGNSSKLGIANPVLFWIAFILGTLILAYAFLLAQVPRGLNTNFTLDYICWTSSAVLMLSCLLVAWRTPKAGTGHRGHTAYPLVTLVAAIELLFSLYGIWSFATSR